MKLLVTRRLPGKALDRLSRECTLDVWGEDLPIPRDELLLRIKEKDGLLCLLNDPIDAEVMDSAPGLRIIANYAVGYDNIDIQAAKARGIVVTNTPGVLTNATADLAWALIFAAARRIVEGDAHVRQGAWWGWDPNLMLGYDIAGATLGIIGAGRIGTAVGVRARGFAMQVFYADENRNETLEQEASARRMRFEDLLKAADFISLHVPLTQATHHLIGENEFALMKPNAILINTSRGPVVDEQALVQALKQGRIAAAGLDVFENEPAVHPGLLDLRNVVLLPHIASSTHSTRSRMADMAADNILAALHGENPPNRVA